MLKYEVQIARASANTGSFECVNVAGVLSAGTRSRKWPALPRPFVCEWPDNPNPKNCPIGNYLPQIKDRSFFDAYETQKCGIRLLARWGRTPFVCFRRGNPILLAAICWWSLVSSWNLNLGVFEILGSTWANIVWLASRAGFVCCSVGGRVRKIVCPLSGLQLAVRSARKFRAAFVSFK